MYLLFHTMCSFLFSGKLLHKDNVWLFEMTVKLCQRTFIYYDTSSTQRHATRTEHYGVH